jgi:hypothetical protein
MQLMALTLRHHSVYPRIVAAAVIGHVALREASPSFLEMASSEA